MTNKNLSCYPADVWDTLQHFFKEEKINYHILHFMASLSGRLDLFRMKTAVSAAITVFPLIRCSYSENCNRPCWKEKDFSADEIVQLIQTGHPDSCIDRFLCQEWKESDGPQLKIAIVRSVKGDTLCVLINHMLCDAAGFKEFLYLLSFLYSNDSPEKNIAADSLAAMRDRSVHQIFTALSHRDRQRFRLSKYQIPKQSDFFQFVGDPKNPFIERRVISEEQFRALIAYAKSRGVTVNDIMLAVFHLAVFREFGKAVPIPCANDLRKYLPNRNAGGICNLVTNLCCDVSMKEDDSFEDTLTKVKAIMIQEKANVGCIKSLMQLENLFHILPYKLVKVILRNNFSNPFIAFTNIGILDSDQLQFGSLEIINAFMTGSIKYAPYFQLALSTFHDEATLSVNLYGTKSDRDKISAFLDQFVLELQNIMNCN